MKLSPIIYLLSAICCLAQPQQAWVARYNGGFTNKNHTPLAIKLDTIGNIYVAGSSQNASNLYDYAILKYAPNGTQFYAARYSSTNGMNFTINGFALDQNGNAYVTGTGGTVRVGTNGVVAWTAPYAGNDVAVDTNGNVYVTGFSTTEYATAKLDANGSNLWTQTYVGVAGPDNPVSVSQKVAVDEAGNVYVAGWTDYPPGWSYPGQTYLNYYSHPVMLMYDGAGNCVWTNAYEGDYGINWGETKGLNPDNQGNIFTATDVGFRHVTKVNLGGQTEWTQNLGSPPPAITGTGMTFDSSGNAYLSGSAYLAVKLGSTNGAIVWSVLQYTSSYKSGSGIALDSSANVFVVANSTTNSFATIKYDPNGNQQWIIPYNGPANGNDGATAIAVAQDGSIYVTGYSANAFGGSDITTIKYGNLANVQKKATAKSNSSFSALPAKATISRPPPIF